MKYVGMDMYWHAKIRPDATPGAGYGGLEVALRNSLSILAEKDGY